MKEKLISFVIAVYNNEKYLKNAVYSVSKEIISDRQLIEIIIVDDGSTDRTSIIADELAAKDDRITVIHQNNQWIYASFNNGVEKSKGKYIYILNSDDIMEHGAVELLIRKIYEYEFPDVIYTKVILCDVDEEQKIKKSRDFNPQINIEEYFENKDVVRSNFLFLQQSNLIVNQANLYKTELLKKYRFDNSVYGADYLFNLDIANVLKSVLVLNVPIYRFMRYENENRNASVGKFYYYEHDMFNLIYDKAKNLYMDWNCYNSRCRGFLVDKRLKEITYEISTLSFPSCKMNVREKFNYIFTHIADAKIRNESRSVGREWEYESRILNGTLNLVEQLNVNSLDGDVDFINDLIENLPQFYLDEIKIDDVERITKAIYNKNNVDNIGKIYYKIC